MGKGFRLAAPSWVVPGTVWENCLFLEGKVDEVAILMLEAEASLAYGRQDLPPDLADLALSFHVHLPADLPWHDGGKAASICLALMDKVDFLGAREAVLHPPGCGRTGGGAAELAACKTALDAFARKWMKAGRALGDILLENTGGNDLSSLADLFTGDGFGLCPDLGHILAYGQQSFSAMLDGLPEEARPRMLHCSAPGTGLPGGAPKSAHCPLDTLDAAGRAAGEALCSRLAPGGIIVAECFNWTFIARSLPVIDAWVAAAGGE